MASEIDNLDEHELTLEIAKSALAGVHTSIPGRVVSYSHTTTPRATVQAVVRFSRMDPETEQRSTYLPEPVANVPVLFPRGANHADTWPLEAGDPVYLIIAERSVDELMATGSNDNVPQDPRRFDISDAFALPANLAGTLPADAIDSAARVLFGDLKLGGATGTDFVALAAKVDSIISTLDTVIRTAWTPVPTDGGAALKAAYTAAFPTPPSSVAATKVEAK